MSNEIIALLEQMINTKIGDSMSKTLSGIVQPNLLEALQSGISLELIDGNLKSIKNTFFGYNKYGNDHISYNNYLNHINATYGYDLLVDKIRQQFNTVEETLEPINSPMSSALNTLKKKLNKRYEVLKELLVLFKVDVSSSLSIIITFNDNDGD